MGHNAPAPTDDGAPGPSQPKERAVADTAEILSPRRPPLPPRR